MLLLIDAGNTRIKWALVEAPGQSPLGIWTNSGSMTHQEFAATPAPWSGQPVERVIVSTVAGAEIHAQLSAALAQNTVEWFVSESSRAGITNRYQLPQQLGSDRFATAIAVHALYPGENIVVATCGTATTIDAVTAQGDFIGGMIAPGLLLMAQSLARNTAQLPQLDVLKNGTAGTAHFANHTHAAILSGCLAAQAGAIEYALNNFSMIDRVDPAAQPLCILSGGAATYIAPSLRTAHRLIDDLVLIGLQKASC